jgi:hypothetical protein
VNEEHINEVIPKVTLSRFVVVQYHDESTGKEEDVRIQEDDEEEDYSTLGQIPRPF